MGCYYIHFLCKMLSVFNAVPAPCSLSLIQSSLEWNTVPTATSNVLLKYIEYWTLCLTWVALKCWWIVIAELTLLYCPWLFPNVYGMKKSCDCIWSLCTSEVLETGQTAALERCADMLIWALQTRILGWTLSWSCSFTGVSASHFPGGSNTLKSTAKLSKRK